MNQIFISYARSDASDIAEFLYERLTSCGYEVWKDDHNIPLGTNFPKAISDALEKTGDFILLVTPSALKSDWVFDEVSMAMTARRRVIPVVLDKNLKDDEIPLFLRKINWLRMANSIDDWEALSKLVDNLEDGKSIPRAFNMSGHKDIEVNGILILGHGEFGYADLNDPHNIINVAKKMAESAIPFIRAGAGIVPHGHPALATSILAFLLGTTNQMPDLFYTYKTDGGKFGISSDRRIPLQKVRDAGFEYRSRA